MSLRPLIAATIYPVIQSVLFGIGVVSTAQLLPADPLASLLSVLAAATLFAIPIAWGLAPRRMSRRDE